MPVCKAEAHRALELLEDYYAKLEDSDKQELKTALEQVIKIFKSRLFQALLDIQEFYDLTLMDEGKPNQTKAAEAAAMAYRWEATNRPFPAKTTAAAAATANDVNHHNNNNNNTADKQQIKDNYVSTLVRQTRSVNRNEYDEIVLERGTYGLGFSIAGGTDNPHVGQDTSIYITKLIPGGAAAIDKRLRINDIILKVNEISVVNVSHAVAVEALKRAGGKVTLSIMRKKNVEATIDMVTVVLHKGTKGLGFTIAGGIGNQHIPGDNGIYVTKVMDGGTAAVDGRIDVGDRLVSILNFPTGEFVLDNCTHEDAVAGLKKCKDKVVLQVAKAEVPYASSPTIGQMQPMVGQYQMPTQTAMGVPREVTIQKGAAGLGFNIVGGEDGEGIFISFILPGGPADLSGQIYRGDKILGVNGIDLTQATHEAAAEALKGAGGTINLRLLYCPGDYERFESKIHSIKGQVVSRAGAASAEKNLFVRALFDNNSSQSLHGKTVPGQELKFSFGDILHIVHATDNDWWLARHINQLGQELATGIIPSRSCWEKIVASRGIGHVDNGGSGSKWQQQKENSVESESKGILSYEVVQKREINYTRPVIVLGPLKDRINDELISEFPERFSSCVPHTTRPKRQFEVDGRDYHFVQSREQMERDIQNHKFIEAGQYNDNLYGTSIASVKDVAESSKHCILDVSGNAIRRLQAAQLFPVAIFINPVSPEFVRHLNGGALTEEQCKKSFARAKRLEEDFLQYFTATVRGEDFEDIYSKVKKLIGVHSANKIWVPANETV